MVSLFLKTFFLIVILLSHFLMTKKAHGFVKDPMYDELEGAALVRALLKDGKLDLAKDEIQALQKGDKNSFHLLKGQWFFQKNEWQQALKEWAQLSKESSTTLAEASVWQGRSYLQLKDFKKCKSVYQNILQNQFAMETDFINKATCEQKSGTKNEAWKTLWTARERFHSFAIEQEVISLLIDLKMIHEGLNMSLAWLAQHQSPATHALNLAEMFQSRQASSSALTILEMARAQYPSNMDVNLALSQIYFQKNWMWAAEEGFRRAAINDSKYYYHTAELNRQTKRFERSLYFNSSVVDEKERLKQKIATYVDANKYSLIASLDSVIQRSELQKDDEVRYALAYSLVRMGAIDRPLSYLSQITKPELIEKTTVLRQTLLECQTKKEVCRL